MIGYMQALLDCYRTSFVSETFPVTVAATILLAWILWMKRKKCDVQKYHTYVWKDLLLLAMCQVMGCLINDFYQNEQTLSTNTIVLFCLLFLTISISAAEISLFGKIGSLFFCLALAIAVRKVCEYESYVDDWMVYCVLRYVTYFSYAAVISDVVLYYERKKRLAAQAEETEEIFREKVLYRLSFQQVLVYLAIAVLFIHPSNLNYVLTATGYSYGDEIRLAEDYIDRLTSWSGEKVSDTSEIVETTESEEKKYPELAIRRTDMLESLADYIYPYNTSRLDYYGNETLNSHGISMNFINERYYSNPLLAEIKEITGKYQINPSYLFVELLDIDSTKAAKFTIAPPEDLSEIILSDGQDMTETAYAKAIMEMLVGNLSFGPDKIDIAMQENCYYSYFAVCEKDTLYYVTLYLQFDATGRLVGADYTLLQFVDLNTETAVCPDYSAELEAVFASAFGGRMNANFRGYNTILEQDGNQVLLRRYNNSYS